MNQIESRGDFRTPGPDRVTGAGIQGGKFAILFLIQC